MTRVSACFYHSEDPTSIVAAVLVKIKYPTTEFYDINGLNAVAVSALCASLTAQSYHDVYVVCDVDSSNFNSFIDETLNGDMTTLAGALIPQAPGLDPMPDAGVADYSAQDNGLLAPDRKLRALILFEALWPTKPTSKLVSLLGGYLLSATDQVNSVSAYSGIRAKNLDLTNGDFLQDLKDAIDENSRLNLDTTIAESYPQSLDVINSLIADGEVVTSFIAATGVAFPEAPIVVH